jgi:hypothetical protein
MCTVTYLPLHKGFILTSNRDERLLRKPSTAPQIQIINDVSVLFPRDTEANGTWMATSQNGKSICLLNGAFEPHHHNPPYRKSRGLVVLDFFENNTAEEFNAEYDLKGIEPFTMVIVEKHALYELRWDGTKKYFTELNPQIPHIYSSATLYTKPVIAMREKWFADWLTQHTEYLVNEILIFHLFAGEGDTATQIRMSRAGIVQTVSITSIVVDGETHNMYYADLRNNPDVDFNIYGFEPNSSATPIKIG